MTREIADLQRSNNTSLTNLAASATTDSWPHRGTSPSRGRLRRPSHSFPQRTLTRSVRAPLIPSGGS